MSCHVTGAYFKTVVRKACLHLTMLSCDAGAREEEEVIFHRRSILTNSHHADVLRCLWLLGSIDPTERNRQEFFIECPRLLLTKRGEKTKSWLENAGKKYSTSFVPSSWIICVQWPLCQTSCLWFHLRNISLQLTVPSLVCFCALSFHL